jgi:uncharacterized protein
LKRPSACVLPVAILLAAQTERAAAIPPPPYQTTADCAAPTYAVDMLVCGDPVLRGLDAQLARLLATPGACAAETETQTDWFRRRSLCAFETDAYRCVEAAYRARIAALRDHCRPNR